MTPAERVAAGPHFARALALVLQAEGGYANDPDDPGGETQQGITTRTYHAWLARHGAPPRSVREIITEEVAAIYHESYWLPAQCDRLPWPLAAIHFDCAVNTGVRAAIKQLQRALAIEDDGIMGPITIARATPAGPRDCYRYLLERVFYYRAIARRTPTQTKFLVGGWLARIEVLYREVA